MSYSEENRPGWDDLMKSEIMTNGINNSCNFE